MTRPAIITPRTPAAAPRQLDFASSASAESESAAASAHLQRHAQGEPGGHDPDAAPPADADAAAVPVGVVNIYPRPEPSSARRQSCSCPANRCVAVDTSLGFSHVAHYGEEHGEVLREAEARQVDKIHRLLPGYSPDSSPADDTNSDFGSDDDEDDDDDAFSVDGEEEGAGGRRGAASRAARSIGSAQSNRRLNLQETFGAAAVAGGGGGLGGAIVRERPHLAARNEAGEAMVRQPYLSPKMRSILIHWLVEVGQEYKLSDAAFHLSVSLLDHLLLKGPTQAELDEHDDNDDGRELPWFLVQRSDFQAVGWYVACQTKTLSPFALPSRRLGFVE